MSTQNRYNSLDKHGQKLFRYMQTMNGTRVTDYKQMTEAQILDEVEKKMGVRAANQEANQIMSRPRLAKWQGILKKDKKDMKTGQVYSSDREGKKIMMLTHEGKKIHAGAKGYGNFKGKGKNRGGGTHTNKKRRANFKARHNCDQCKGKITTPKCLACKKLW